MDELELIFYPDDKGVEIIIEFDRKTRGFSGLLSDMLDTDESQHHYFFSREELKEGTSTVADQFRGIFDELLDA